MKLKYLLYYILLPTIFIVGISSTKKIDWANGITGSSTVGCGGCHGPEAGTLTLSGMDTTILPNTTYPISILYNLGINCKYWGIDLKCSAGTLTPGTGMMNRGNLEIIHSSPLGAKQSTSYNYTGIKWNSGNLAPGTVVNFTFATVGGLTTGGTSNSYVSKGSFTLTVGAPVVKCSSGNKSYSTEVVSTCNISLPYQWNGSYYTSPGIYATTFAGANSQGCDSIAALNLSINNATFSINRKTICQSSLPYTWNGIIFNSADSQSLHMLNSKGCDSAVIMVLKVAALPYQNNVLLNGCDSVIHNGKVYKTATVLFDTLKNQQGCDSLYNRVTISISKLSISGNIITPLGKPIPNVTANIKGAISQQVTDGFNYGFYCLNIGDDTVKLNKNNDINKSNGITMSDLVILQSHILGKSLISNPYKLIAADVNGDLKITLLDVVNLKRVILGIDTTFINSTTGEKRLWAFVDSSYQFPVITNPFPFKDSISYTGLSANKTNQTFIGIKLGDVNWDWNPAIAKMPSPVFVKPKILSLRQ